MMCFAFWATAFVNVFHGYSTNIVHLHESHKRLTVVGVWLHSLPHTPQTNKGVFAWGIICQMKTASCALSLRQLNCRIKVMYWCCDYRFCFICAVISTFLTRVKQSRGNSMQPKPRKVWVHLKHKLFVESEPTNISMMREDKKISMRPFIYRYLYLYLIEIFMIVVQTILLLNHMECFYYLTFGLLHTLDCVRNTNEKVIWRYVIWT